MRTRAEYPFEAIGMGMSPSPSDIKTRASLYADRRELKLKQALGSGKDGSVFATNMATAIKVHGDRASFDRELACYRRLLEHGVLDVRGHRVPQLVAWEDELLVIEMTIVWPPFLLDFGDAYLDESLSSLTRRSSSGTRKGLSASGQPVGNVRSW
jgi:hypothetical protein